MKQVDFGKHASFVAVLLLALLPFLFFFPATLGRVVLGDQDAIFYFFPAYRLAFDQLRAFQFPLWNPNVYSGMPLFAVWQAGVLDPLNWIFLVTGVTGRSLSVVQQLSFSLALVSTYLYSRSVGMMRRSAIVAAIVYGLSGFLVARSLYPGLLHAAAITPLVLYCIERSTLESAEPRLSARFIALGSLAFAWQIFAGHPQPVVYSALLGVSYALYRRSIRSLLIFAGGVGIGAIQWLPAWEAGRQSVRDSWTFEMFSQHSLNPVSIIVSIMPFFHGGGRGIYSMPYWGEYWHHLESQIYLGFFALSLAIAGGIAAWRFKDRIGIFWTIAGGLALLLSLGGYFPPLAWIAYHIPVLGHFRSPNRHWMEVALACGVLAGSAIDRIMRDGDRPVIRAVTRTAIRAVTALTTLVAVVAVYVLWIARWPGAGREFWLPVITGLISIAAVAAISRFRSTSIAVAVLLIDFGLYAYFAPVWSAARPEDALGSARPHVATGDARLHLQLSVGSGEFDPRLYYGVRMATGYDPLVNARYKEFTGINEAGHSHLKTLLNETDRTLDVLNVKYVVAGSRLVDEMRANKRWREVDTGVFENLNVLSAAWFEDIRRPENEYDSVRAIRGEIAGFAPMQANAVVKRPSPSKLEIEVNADKPATLVLSETYWPGWHARVDGQDVPVKRVNYVLRGIDLDTGRHQIVMWYWPSTMTAGVIVSCLTLLAIGVLVFSNASRFLFRFLDRLLFFHFIARKDLHV